MNNIIRYYTIDEISKMLVRYPINKKRIYLESQLCKKWVAIDDLGMWDNKSCEMAVRFSNFDVLKNAIKVKKYSELKKSRSTKPYDIDLYISESRALKMTVWILNTFIEFCDYSETKKPNAEQIQFIAESLITEKDMYFEDIAMMLRLGISEKLGTIYNVIRMGTVSGEWLRSYRNWRMNEQKIMKDLENNRLIEKQMNAKGVQCPDYLKMDLTKIGRIPRQRGEMGNKERKALKYRSINEYFKENRDEEKCIEDKIKEDYKLSDKLFTFEQFREYYLKVHLNQINKSK